MEHHRGRVIDLSAFVSGGQEVRISTLADKEAAGEPDVANSFAEPDRVSPVESTARGATPRLEYRFPPLSLTVFELQVAQRTN